jgi:hypothetical protein
MNCREFEADVVDLARGAQMSVAAAERLGAHLEQCVACTARVARERHLTTALKAMAGAVPPSTRSAAIEAQLLMAFARRQAVASRPAPPSRSVLATPPVRVSLAAAAVLVLAVAVWQGTARWRSTSETTPVSTQAAANPAAPTPTAAGGAAVPAAASTSGGARASAAITAPPEDAAAPASPRRAPAMPTPAQAAVPRNDNDVLRFVTLPTAVGLPPLESGRIVRVDVPTAMLPAYGFEVAPDSQSGMVEADVLVGQDGQPRAIRFVTLDSESRRRK